MIRKFTSGARAAFAIWRILLLAQLREQPARLCITVLAIALGVALGAAVFLVNTSALNEFGLATKRLVGESDIVIRGPRDGFAEQLFVKLAKDLGSVRRARCSSWTWRWQAAATRSRYSGSTCFAPPRCSPRSPGILAKTCFSFLDPTAFT